MEIFKSYKISNLLNISNIIEKTNPKSINLNYKFNYKSKFIRIFIFFYSLFLNIFQINSIIFKFNIQNNIKLNLNVFLFIDPEYNNFYK